MRKILLIVAIVSLIVILGIVGFLWLTSNFADETRAQLVIVSGTAQIKHSGESWIFAQNGTLLEQSDSVKTGENSSAMIIFFKSSIIRLDSNTEVMLEELLEQEGETSIKILQDAGRTWNTVSKISGIDNYDVQTPTAIASIRGTSFDVNHYSNGTTVISMDNGNSNVSRTEIDNVDIIEVNENESVTIYPNDTGQVLEKKPFVKDDWILTNRQKDDRFLDNVKDDLFERIEQYIPELKQRYGVTEEELDALMEGYIRGYYNLPPETPEWMREIIEVS